MTRLLRRRPLGAACAAVFATLGTARAAHAVNCADLPSPVYVLGGNSPKPFVAKVATSLTNSSPPTSIILQAPGACVGVDAILGIGNTTITGTASYWDTNGKENTCNLSTLGDAVQVGVGNNYAELCPEVTTAPPATFGEFLGPVLGIDFVVPLASSQANISAAAAYFAYGFGATMDAAPPWINESLLFKRNTASAIALLVGKAVGVPAASLKGIDTVNSAGMITDVSTASNPEAALGMVSDDVAQANPNAVRVLAYQHTDQSCGYWPSSTDVKFDKENIRDGHYYLWAYTHFYATVNASGDVVDPGAKAVIPYFIGTAPLPNGDDIDKLATQAATIPQCAMEVKRLSDLGPINPYAPDAPCGCMFSQVATGNTTCQACPSGNDSECPTSATHCRHNYCEVN